MDYKENQNWLMIRCLPLDLGNRLQVLEMFLVFLTFFSITEDGLGDIF